MSTGQPLLHQLVRQAAHPLVSGASDYTPLLDLIGEAEMVLLGEASHGTHEFYRERAQLTKLLIQEKGFTVVAVEADWPDSYRVNRFARGLGPDASATEALEGFQRFPRWMWRNADVLDFIGWLREHNDLCPAPKVGFYGLDLYSLYASMEGVLKYLDQVDPEAARRARRRYGCFEPFKEDSQEYGYAATLGLTASCEQAVRQQLLDLQQHGEHYIRHNDGEAGEDAFFYAEQNARLVRNAEFYYRMMFRGRTLSWNLRDQHMTETLFSLRHHLATQRGELPKIVVWAHNSHLGDARATEMGRAGQLNVGQLVRERLKEQAVLVGFTTYAGTVTAASEWEGLPERKRVRPALPESYEALFHQVGLPRFLISLRDHPRLAQALHGPYLERAIGVLYKPETERMSHYFSAWLPEQFDAVLHFDETRAVEPLERTVDWHREEVPETYPFAL